MQAYTLGFAFNAEGTEVVLIRKARPSWQKGKLNGVGGKVEPGETDIACMVREFREETGIATTETDWHLYATMQGDYIQGAFRIAVYRMLNNAALAAQSPNDETIEIHTVKSDTWQSTALSNLQWLIPAALDPDAPRITLAATYAQAA